MKQRNLLLFVICTVINIQPSLSQKLSIGFQTGTCFANSHGDFTYDSWKGKPGPVSNFFINYSLTRHFSLQTELDYTNQYYIYNTYGSNNNSYAGPMPSSIAAFDQIASSQWDLDFYRIPLFFTFSEGTNLKMSISAGGYISILANHDGVLPQYPAIIDFSNSYYPNYYNNPNPPKFDHGLCYALSISYPISYHFRAYLNGRYFIGKTRYIDYYNLHLSAEEWAVGLSYSGFSKKDRPISSLESTEDTSIHRLHIQAKAGYSISRNVGDNNHRSYFQKSSMSGGISMSYLLNKTFSLNIDGLYRRMGYFMKDSSAQFFRYVPSAYSMYKVNTKIDIDYFQIPILIKFNLGGPLSVYLNTGPYISMLLNARVTGTAYSTASSAYGYSSVKIQVYDNMEGYLHPTDRGWIYGGGMKIPLFNKYALDIELRYEKSNRNVFNSSMVSDQPNTNSDKTLYNESFSVLLGMLIPFN
jgi:hypothetical protein